jgi:hypothetical protein
MILNYMEEFGKGRLEHGAVDENHKTSNKTASKKAMYRPIQLYIFTGTKSIGHPGNLGDNIVLTALK